MHGIRIIQVPLLITTLPYACQLSGRPGGASCALKPSILAFPSTLLSCPIHDSVIIMPSQVPILAQSENKSRFLERLGISDQTDEGKRVYAMMKVPPMDTLSIALN